MSKVDETSSLFSKDHLQFLSLKLGVQVEINKTTGKLKGINNLKLEVLKSILGEFQLSTIGNSSELRSRLDSFVTLNTNNTSRI